MGFKIEHSPFVASEDYQKFVIMEYSNHSYAVNKKITSLFDKDTWRGKPCFIVGGGTSLKEFDFKKLDGKLTIGINKAFLNFSPVINYAMDSNFHRGIFDGTYDEQEGCRVVDKWLSFKGYKIFLTPMELYQFADDTHLVRRKYKFEINQTNLDAGIYGGLNSAVGAINLAIALNAAPIYLLGYDMKCGEKTHYHKGYPDRDPKEFNSKLQEYKSELEGFAPLWKEKQIPIFNLGPDSDLKCFPFADLPTVLGV